MLAVRDPWSLESNAQIHEHSKERENLCFAEDLRWTVQCMEVTYILH